MLSCSTFAIFILILLFVFNWLGRSRFQGGRFIRSSDAKGVSVLTGFKHLLRHSKFIQTCRVDAVDPSLIQENEEDDVWREIQPLIKM